MVINLCLPQFRPRIHCNKHSVSGCHLLGRAQTTSAMTPSVITLPSRKRKPEQAEHSSDYSLGMDASSSAPSPLLSPTTSEPTAKKMKAPSEPALTDMDCSAEHPRSVCGPECASCKRAFSSYSTKEPVYQLPCGHLLCRPCLNVKQRSQPMMCAACQQPVTSQDVFRVHF